MKLRIILKNYNNEYPRYIVQKQIIPLFWKNIQEFIIPIFCKLNAYHFNNKEEYEKISNTKTKAMIFMKSYEAVIKNNKLQQKLQKQKLTHPQIIIYQDLYQL